MPEQTAVPVGGGRHVLLVEDNEAAGRGLARLLESLGFIVTNVLDGETALKELRSSRSFDFVLTDLQLPDLDGREVARTAHRRLPTPRVILFTGWDLEMSGALREEWGIDHVLRKPIDLAALSSALGD